MNFTKVVTVKQLNEGDMIAVSTSELKAGTKTANLSFGKVRHVNKPSETVLIVFNNLASTLLEVSDANLPNFGLYLVKVDTNELRKQNRKMANKLHKYETIMKDNGTVSVQSIQQSANIRKANEKRFSFVSSDPSIMAGYHVTVSFFTNHVDIVQCKIQAYPIKNPGLIDVCTATGEAKVAYGDKFSYSKGKELAYARALNAFLEGMM